MTSCLGTYRETSKKYDTVELVIRATKRLPLLVEQGLGDEFLANQLRPDLLKTACEKYDHPITLNMSEGYDNSYYFMTSFIGEHIAYHAKALKN